MGRTAVRQIAERRANGSGRVQEASGRMLTAATVYEVIQQRGFDQVLAGELNPTVKDMLSATAALREIERASEGQFSTAYLLSQLNRVIEVIHEFIPEELWPEVVERLGAGEPRSRYPQMTQTRFGTRSPVMSAKCWRQKGPVKCGEVQLRKDETHMHVKENHRQSGMSAAEEEALTEFRSYLSRRISNAVEALREEVPREAWPRVAARLEAVGVVVPPRDA